MSTDVEFDRVPDAELDLYDLSRRCSAPGVNEAMMAGELSFALTSANAPGNLDPFVGACAMVDLSAGKGNSVSVGEVDEVLVQLQQQAEKFSKGAGLTIAIPERILVRTYAGKDRSSVRTLSAECLNRLLADKILLGVDYGLESLELVNLVEHYASKHGAACLFNLDLSETYADLLYDLYAAPLAVQNSKYLPVRPLLIAR